jgi:SulP family sulfate permease
VQALPTLKTEEVIVGTVTLAVLLVVAWNMSEAPHFVRTARIAPRDDKLVRLTCFSLTLLFDMTIAVGVGMALAGVLFFRRTGDLTQTRPIRPAHDDLENIPDTIAIYDINGPLFFGFAHKTPRSLIEVTPQVRVVVLDMSVVSLLDMSALVAMESRVENLGNCRVGLVINKLQPRMLPQLRHAGIRRRQGSILFSRDLHEAIEKARELARVI